MKKILLALLLSASACFGKTWLEWDYPSEWLSKAGGFRIWLLHAGKWEKVADVGTNKTWEIQLPAGVYTLGITAYGPTNAAIAESEMSTPIEVVILQKVQSVRVIIQP